MKDVLTPKELAAAIGVSESSLRRWVDAGVLRTSRTVGGHRRIPMAEAIRFIRESHATVVRPELLGLPEVAGFGGGAGAAGADPAGRLFDALADGDAGRARGIATSLYLTGTPLAEVFDGPVRSAMHRLGELHVHDRERGILVEHRATDVAIRVVAHLSQLVPPAPAGAPVAVGGAPSGDVYLLPSAMAACVLTEAGFAVTNYGADTPLELLGIAARDAGARVAWVSVTSGSAAAKVGRGLDELARALAAGGTELAVGGQEIRAVKRGEHGNVHELPSMKALGEWARGVAGEGTKARRHEGTKG